jgi:hypothetical protein
MEEHVTAPIDVPLGASNSLAAALPPLSNGGTADAETQDGAQARYVVCTVLGCIASFGIGLAVGGNGWNVSRGTVAGGLLASALAGGLAGGYALRWRKRPASRNLAQRTAEPVFQVTHEDVIGDILQPLNELNRGLRRDVKSGAGDGSGSPWGPSLRQGNDGARW